NAVRGVDVRYHRRRIQVHVPRPEGVWQPDVAQRGRGHSGGNGLRGAAAAATATTSATGACVRTPAGRGSAAATAATACTNYELPAVGCVSIHRQLVLHVK